MLAITSKSGPFSYRAIGRVEGRPERRERAMISVGDVAVALIEFVAEFVWSFWPWHGGKKDEK
jgi:hypothetical protein